MSQYKLVIISFVISTIFVKLSENWTTYCPPDTPEGIKAYDLPGCSFGLPIPYVGYAGFAGYQTSWPIFLLDVVIVTLITFSALKIVLMMTKKA